MACFLISRGGLASDPGRLAGHYFPSSRSRDPGESSRARGMSARGREARLAQSVALHPLAARCQEGGEAGVRERQCRWRHFACAASGPLATT